MRIAVIGCGVMGGAFAKYFAKTHVVLLYDRNKTKAQALAEEVGAISKESLSSVIEEAELVLLAIKPKDLLAVAQAGANAFAKEKILISILSGTPISVLKRHFPNATVIRSMPNLALTSGQGVIGVVEESYYPPQVKQQVNKIFEGIGFVTWMPEDKIDALTALSGSGIGFIFVMIEAMIDGGIYLGFAAKESREIVLKTFEGAIALMRESSKHPAELKLQITSPGGTTIAGLKVMEEKAVRAGIVHTLVACYEKALSMEKTWNLD